MRYPGVPIATLNDTQKANLEIPLPAAAGASRLDPPSLGEALQILGTGAAGPILMALGAGPLRTKRLTERIAHFDPRTVYRHAQHLTRLELVERREEAGIPSVVFYRLSDERGRELFRVLDAYGGGALPRSDDGQVEGSSWTLLRLLGEMWSAGWIDELSRGARSATELSEITEGMTFHQVSRRVRLLVARGLLNDNSGPGKRRRYLLSNKARRSVGLVVALGRWRWRQLDGSSRGLTVAEMSAALRSAMPLIKLSDHSGLYITIGIAGAKGEQETSGASVLRGRIGQDGSFRWTDLSSATPDAWMAGSINTWSAAILDGKRGRMRMGGDADLVDACLTQLHETLGNGK